MSITDVKSILCRRCGGSVSGLTVESANPTRHPTLQEHLLARTLLLVRCPRCGDPHQHYTRFVWTDLPGRLCALVVHEEEQPGWRALEVTARLTLAGPLTDEGPAVVRQMGAAVRLRLVFGLEELREKVLCGVNDLDDRLVEQLKLTLADPAPLDGVEPGARLRFAGGQEIPWQRYAEARPDPTCPGLFASDATWISHQRAREAPFAG